MSKLAKTGLIRYGQQYGHWTTLSLDPHKQSKTRWLCKCACGMVKPVVIYFLLEGTSKSCGCEGGKYRSKEWHGLSKTPGYKTWKGMLSRCLQPNDPGYARYGGRGITICSRWLESFKNFLDDMGPQPTPGYSLDRKDNSLGYYKENCHWTTWDVQNRNRRDNVFLEKDGERLILPDWAKKYNIALSTLQRRLRTGMTFDQALTTPLRHHGRNTR